MSELLKLRLMACTKGLQVRCTSPRVSATPGSRGSYRHMHACSCQDALQTRAKNIKYIEKHKSQFNRSNWAPLVQLNTPMFAPTRKQPPALGEPHANGNGAPHGSQPQPGGPPLQQANGGGDNAGSQPPAAGGVPHGRRAVRMTKPPAVERRGAGGPGVGLRHRQSAAADNPPIAPASYMTPGACVRHSVPRLRARTLLHADCGCRTPWRTRAANAQGRSNSSHTLPRSVWHAIGLKKRCRSKAASLRYVRGALLQCRRDMSADVTCSLCDSGAATAGAHVFQNDAHGRRSGARAARAAYRPCRRVAG